MAAGRQLLAVLVRVEDHRAELIVRVAASLVNAQRPVVESPVTGDGEIDAAVGPQREARVFHAVAGDDSRAAGTAGLGIEAPFAALANHYIRVGRANRTAERSIAAGAEEFADELAGLRVPDADALGRAVGFGDPELAFGVDGHAANGAEAIRLPGAKQRAATGQANGKHGVLALLHGDLIPGIALAQIGESVLQIHFRRFSGILAIRHWVQLNQLARAGIQFSQDLRFMEGQPQLAVIEAHFVCLLRLHLGVRRPKVLDLQISAVSAFPFQITAILGVQLVKVRAVGVHADVAAQHVEHTGVCGQRLHARHAAVIVAPLDAALEIAGEHGLARFRAAPAEIDLFVVRGHRDRQAVVATPVAFTVRAVPRSRATVAGPTAQLQADAAMGKRAPGVLTRRHRFAGTGPRPSGETVPLHLVFAFGEGRAVEQLADDLALRVLQV